MPGPRSCIASASSNFEEWVYPHSGATIQSDVYVSSTVLTRRPPTKNCNQKLCRINTYRPKLQSTSVCNGSSTTR